MSNSVENPRKATGPWWSHMAYGLGVILIFVPFMIPGVDSWTVFVIYMAAINSLIILALLWGVVRNVRAAFRRRRLR